MTIYRKLFESIVDEMNQTLEVGDASASDELGILDMYGFESLEINGLAQILSCRECLIMRRFETV